MNSAIVSPTERYESYFAAYKKFPKEVEEGNIEYKLKLDPNPLRFEHLLSQMKWRLYEYGICYYLVGVDDDGTIRCTDSESLEYSYQILERLAQRCDAHIINKIVYKVAAEEGSPNKETHFYLQVSIGKTAKQTIEDSCNFNNQINVCLIGPFQSGKSTLAASIGNVEERDDGEGRMRMHMLRHRHEILSGKTSCISYRYVREEEEQGIIFRLIDTPGHLKYRNTLLRCLTTHNIDLCILVMEANENEMKETFELFHQYCTALKLHLIIVITKIDSISASNITTNLQQLITHSKEELGVEFEIMNHFNETSKIPLILVSCVNGEGLGTLWMLLKQFGKTLNRTRLNNIIKSCSNNINTGSKTVKFCIEKVLSLVEGTVLYGYVIKGTIDKTTEALLGPSNDGHFPSVRIISLMKDKKLVENLIEGSSGSILIKFTEDISSFVFPIHISTGMVLVDRSEVFCGKYKIFDSFEVELFTLSSRPSTRIYFGSILVRGTFHECSMFPVGKKETNFIVKTSTKLYVRPADKVYFVNGIFTAIGQVIRLKEN